MSFTCFIQRLFNSVLITEFDIAIPRKGALTTRFQSYVVFCLETLDLFSFNFAFLVVLWYRRDERCLWSSLVPVQEISACFLLGEVVYLNAFSLREILNSVSQDFSPLGWWREAVAPSLPGLEGEEGASHSCAKERSVPSSKRGFSSLRLGRGFRLEMLAPLHRFPETLISLWVLVVRSIGLSLG